MEKKKNRTRPKKLFQNPGPRDGATVSIFLSIVPTSLPTPLWSSQVWSLGCHALTPGLVKYCESLVWSADAVPGTSEIHFVPINPSLDLDSFSLLNNTPHHIVSSHT